MHCDKLTTTIYTHNNTHTTHYTFYFIEAKHSVPEMKMRFGLVLFLASLFFLFAVRLTG